MALFEMADTTLVVIAALQKTIAADKRMGGMKSMPKFQNRRFLDENTRLRNEHGRKQLSFR